MARTSTKTAVSASSNAALDVRRLEHVKQTFGLLSLMDDDGLTSPLVLNSMSVKAKRDLLFPIGRLNAAAKAARLKHDPLPEYQASIYQRKGNDLPPDRHGNVYPAPTRILFPAPAMKSVMATASLEMAGVTKASIERLTWVDGRMVPIYGVPKLLMSVVRNSDMKKTPDIRTRAIIEDWCALVSINYVTGKLNATNITNLLYNGGLICGIGDWRQEKGSGSNGRFEVVNYEMNPETRIVVSENIRMNLIMQTGGLEAQDAAIAAPQFFDDDSEELFFWFQEELIRRGDTSKRKKKSDEDERADVATVVAAKALEAGMPLDETPIHSGLTPAQMKRARGNGLTNGGGKK